MGENVPCAFCHTACQRGPDGTFFLMVRYDCPNCGSYLIDEDVAERLESDRESAFHIACVLREKELAGTKGFFAVLDDDFEPSGSDFTKHIKTWWRIGELLAEFPKATTMVDRALANLARKALHPMDVIRVGISELEYLTFCRSLQLSGLIDYMKNCGLLSLAQWLTGCVDFSISPMGWSRLEELSKAGTDSKQAFVAMWFADEMDAFYENGMNLGIKDAGFDAKRIDNKEHNNKICDEIIAEIRRSRFIVADFSAGMCGKCDECEKKKDCKDKVRPRGGVYFEAGFAMGLGIPVIWTVRKDQLEQIHFDIRQYNFIVYDTAEDLRVQLHNRIAATIR